MARELCVNDVKTGRLTLIDVPIPVSDFGRFLSVWLIEDFARDRTLLVETGPAVSVPHLVEELRQLGVRSVDYLVCTHIHLDHSGGVGHFLSSYPRAKVICPGRGREHLHNPARLWEASLAVLGDVARVYREPLPVPEENFYPSGALPGGLDELDTPGHAPHHSSYLYHLGAKKILFVGEAAGVCVRIEGELPYLRPATPARFRYEIARDSLLALQNVDADAICYPHYGLFEDPRRLLALALSQLDFWWETVCELDARGLDVEAMGRTLLARDPLLRSIDQLEGEEPLRERRFISQSLMGFVGAAREHKEAQNKIQ